MTTYVHMYVNFNFNYNIHSGSFQQNVQHCPEYIKLQSLFKANHLHMVFLTFYFNSNMYICIDARNLKKVMTEKIQQKTTSSIDIYKVMKSK